jgi:CPA1 family monovalent cation:H+ antiporter
VQAVAFLLLLLGTVAAVVTVSRRVRVPYPVLLLVAGLILGAVPAVPHVDVDSETILLFVLPPIVYVAAFFTPVRSFKQELGNIVSLAIGLVVASTAAVAVAAIALVPALTIPIAVALGAAVAPPDAIAATSVFQRLAVPRRITAVLEGESLVNDATALTIYRVAILAAASGASIFAVGTFGEFIVASVIGIAVGVAIGWVAAEVRTRLSDAPVEITISLLTPYAAFLPAYAVGASGVLAALTAGLYVGRRASRIMGSDVRLTGRAVWETLLFLINGFVFILIGLQITAISGRIESATFRNLALVGLAVSAVLIAVRAAWLLGMALWQRLVSHRRARLRLAEVLVLSWAGMRGVVSLAAALAVPAVAAGGPTAARDAVIVITFTVILITLVGQGLTLPAVIKLAHLGGDDDHRHEESHARQDLIQQALRRIETLATEWPTHQPLIDQLRTSYQHRAEHEEQLHEAPSTEAEQELVEHRAIRRAVIDAQREALLTMRDRGVIDDDTVRAIERELDLEEVRMEA